MKRFYTLAGLSLTAFTSFAQPDCVFENILNLEDTLNVPCNECVTLSATYPSINATNTYSIEEIEDATPPYPLNAGNVVISTIDDTWSALIPMDFSFCFFGQTYTSAVLGSNGLITFNAGEANGFCPWSFNQANPNPGLPTNAIFAPYHDIDPGSCGNIRWQVYGEEPCRRFVTSFDNVCMFSCSSVQSSSQIVLYEGTNVIDVYVVNKPPCAGWNSGNSLIGIQNGSGTVGFTPPGRNTGNWSTSNEAWRFVPAGDPDGTLTWFDGQGAELGTDLVEVCPDSAATYYAVLNYDLCGQAPGGDGCENYQVNVSEGSWPSEVSWNLINSGGVTVATGGAGFSGNVCLANDCFTLQMLDSFGDGWNGANFTISYEGTTIATATLNSGSIGTATFCVDEFVEDPGGDDPSPFEGAFLIDSVYIDIAQELVDFELSAPDLLCTYDTTAVVSSTEPGGVWTASCGDCMNPEGVFNVDVVSEGSYFVYYEIEGVCGPVIDSVQLVIQAPPQLSFETPEALCAENEPVQLIANEEGGVWEADCIGCISPEGLFDPAGLSPGVYTISYTAGESCPITETLTIEIDETLSAAIESVPPFCEDEMVQLVASESGGFWTASCGGCIDSVSGLLDATSAGPGTVNVTYDFDSFCSVPTSIELEISAQVDADISEVPPLCETGNPVQLVSEDPMGVWEASCGSCLNDQGIFDPAASEAGSFVVTYTIAGVCNDIDEVTVEVLDQADASFTVPEQICLDAGTFDLTAAQPGGEWSSPDCNGCINGDSGLIDLVAAEQGVFEIFYEFEGLCGDEASAVTELIPCQVNAPNVFSPNQDGVNDTFSFESLEFFPDSRLEVRNRWGALVYEDDDYGSRNNWAAQDVSDGTYFFILWVGGTDQVLKGTVTIHR